MFGWLRRATPATLDDRAWDILRRDVRLLDGLDESAQPRLRERVSGFLADKQFHATHGLEIDERLRLIVAAQCCLPALYLPAETLSGWRDVILYPGAFRARRHEHDEDGIAHEFDEDLIGEADEQSGPIILSVADIEADLAEPFSGVNVILHEIAHKIDARDGACDGVPVIRDLAARRHWIAVMQAAFDRLRAQVEEADEADAEPETDIDPYAAEAPEEFFAVATEAYFSCPQALRAFDSAVFEEFRKFYGGAI
ncbi:MAG TPA: M90 family metallopeptidase [Patescibacteria group bacterium]|nr:M90 family metallopeptidase [Patescibacteria group bacterium]